MLVRRQGWRTGPTAMGGRPCPAAPFSPRASERCGRLATATSVLARTIWRSSAVAAVLGASACWDAPTAALRPTPVVELTLVAGENYQVAFVSLGTDADSVIPDGGVPVPGDQVRLRIEDDSGHVWPLAAVTPGRFGAAVSPQPGKYYRLAGSVVGRDVMARTQVPSSFSLAAPDRDTVTVADTVPCIQRMPPDVVCFRARFESDGATLVRYFAPGGRVGVAPARGPVGDSGEVWLYRSDQLREIAFVAYNADAAAWLWASAPRSNVAGAVGGFGGAVVVRRAVFIP